MALVIEIYDEGLEQKHDPEARHCNQEGVPFDGHSFGGMQLQEAAVALAQSGAALK